MESVALLTHTDGAFFLPIAAIISGLAGYTIGTKSCKTGAPTERKKRREV